MRQYWLGVGLLALTTVCSGCGDGTPNTIAEDTTSPDYGKNSADKMKGMYGVPKVEKVVTKNPGDMMKEMYGNKKK